MTDLWCSDEQGSQLLALQPRASLFSGLQLFSLCSMESQVLLMERTPVLLDFHSACRTLELLSDPLQILQIKDDASTIATIPLDVLRALSLNPEGAKTVLVGVDASKLLELDDPAQVLAWNLWPETLKAFILKEEASKTLFEASDAQKTLQGLLEASVVLVVLSEASVVLNLEECST